MLPKEMPSGAAAPADGTAHRVVLEGRGALTATGVQAVLRCDEQSVCLATGCGTLTIGGQELRVCELNVQSGRVSLAGRVEFLQYTEPREKGPGGLLHRLMR